MRPELPVLPVTGFANAAGDLASDVPRLAKPFRRAELLNSVAELLPARDDADISETVSP